MAVRLSLYLSLSWLLVAVCLLNRADASRCATGLRDAKPDRFAPMRPAPRFGASRAVAPVRAAAGNVLVTEHFRILWGDDYDSTDVQWSDPDGDGIPTWVAVLAEALEESYAMQTGLGFPEPYGSDQYYLDVYVANTGVRLYDTKDASWYSITIGQHFCAYTEIDPSSRVAYFVFSDDFTGYTLDELAVLRATAAHELFHAVQRVDYPWDDEVQVPDARWNQENWWFEATATWMEEVCEPDSDDYVHYVQHFLARPEDPLTSADGIREYGASIFAGYLWLEHGGESLWQAIFHGAFAMGLEKAMDAALADTDRPPVAEVIPLFWTLAAHPEDTWPDGAQFRTASTPKLFRSAATLPLLISTSPFDAPGRYGANLVRIDAFEEILLGSIPESEPGANWSIGVSATGSSEAQSVAPKLGGGTVPLWGDGSQPTYVAVVNTSESPVAAERHCTYRALFTGPEERIDVVEAESTSETASASGGGEGGCFIRLLFPSE